LLLRTVRRSAYEQSIRTGTKLLLFPVRLKQEESEKTRGWERVARDEAGMPRPTGDPRREMLSGARTFLGPSHARRG
jgi:hypothetical protein